MASALSLRPDAVEKDYILGWILYGIQNSMTCNRWLFKGGTCLKKCYFETYRFSEELDFTLTDSSHLTPEFLKSSFESKVANRGRFRVMSAKELFNISLKLINYYNNFCSGPKSDCRKMAGASGRV